MAHVEGSSPSHSADDPRERSFGELAKELSTEISTLVRQEISLARAEMTQKGRTAAPGLGMFGVAGVLGLAAVGALTAFLILLLSTFLDDWLAALIVGVVFALIAAYLARQGKEKVAEAGPPVPEQTKESLKEDVQWAKTQIGSDRRS